MEVELGQLLTPISPEFANPTDLFTIICQPKLLREVIPPGKGRISKEEYLERVRRGQASGMQSMFKLLGSESGAVCIVGGGPTLQDTVSELRHLVKRGAKTFAVNKSHDWLVKRGLPCHYAALLDPKDWIAGYCDLSLAQSKATRKKAGKLYVAPKYLIASQCHDDTINKFKHRPDAYMWHAAAGLGESEILKTEFPKEEWCNIAGASVIGLRAVCLAHSLGFREFYLFGLDGSAKPPKVEGGKPQLYSYDKPQIDGTWKPFDVKLSSGWSRTFLANHHMARSVYEFEEAVKEWDRRIKDGRMEPFSLKVYGDPEVSAIAMVAAGMGIHADPAINDKYSRPPQVDTAELISRAEAYEQAGYRTLAIEAYEEVLEYRPNDLAILRKLAKLCPFEDSGRLLDHYERGAAPLRLAHLSDLAVRKEAAERQRLGLSPYAETPEDLTFRFARVNVKMSEVHANELYARNPDDAEALLHKGYCARANGRLLDAQRYFHAGRQSFLKTVFFADEFYRQLEGETFEGLPEVADLKAQTFNGPVIFLACDGVYFRKFARPLLRSIEAKAPGSNVHLHVMNAEPEEVAAFCETLNHTKVAISTEQTTGGRNYYHAARFIRMSQYLERYQQPLWLMDVDGLMNNVPPLGEQADVMLVGHAGRWEPWFQFNASVVGVRPTAKGKRYLTLVAAYINHFRDQLWWGIDQMALYGVYEHLKDSTNFRMLPPNTLDGEYTEDGIIWTNGTSAKFSDVKTLKDVAGEPDSPRLKYLKTLESYEHG